MESKQGKIGERVEGSAIVRWPNEEKPLKQEMVAVEAIHKSQRQAASGNAGMGFMKWRFQRPTELIVLRRRRNWGHE